nr:hypothetical protein [Algoriphagus litoralis]
MPKVKAMSQAPYRMPNKIKIAAQNSAIWEEKAINNGKGQFNDSRKAASSGTFPWKR